MKELEDESFALTTKDSKNKSATEGDNSWTPRPLLKSFISQNISITFTVKIIYLFFYYCRMK